MKDRIAEMPAPAQHTYIQPDSGWSVRVARKKARATPPRERAVVRRSLRML
jgi:hypothetical protein